MANSKKSLNNVESLFSEEIVKNTYKCFLEFSPRSENFMKAEKTPRHSSILCSSRFPSQCRMYHKIFSLRKLNSFINFSQYLLYYKISRDNSSSTIFKIFRRSFIEKSPFKKINKILLLKVKSLTINLRMFHFINYGKRRLFYLCATRVISTHTAFSAKTF